MSLDAYLRAQPGRCPDGYDHDRQPGLCVCPGLAAKATGQAQATAAHPDERAAVDSAIRKLAATGRPFSANDARALHGVKGGVVGAAFTAARNAGLIRAVGDDTSTGRSANGHRIYQWIGTAA